MPEIDFSRRRVFSKGAGLTDRPSGGARMLQISRNWLCDSPLDDETHDQNGDRPVRYAALTRRLVSGLSPPGGG
ncbi:hypothetical protein AXW83_18900 [Bosea sp. PAMC 26642]|nr:hypothetical protein AXW83_18900 [Bosea sp. PAMC 26642]